LRYLILSDLHANLHALEAVLEDAAVIGFDQVLVLGDLVDYGADPAAVMDRTMATHPAAIIRGNHDKVCSGLEPPFSFSEDARQACLWTHATLSADHLQVLAALRKGPQSVEPGLSICHGAPDDEDRYVLSANDAAIGARVMTDRICLFGHTHIPSVFVVTNWRVRALAPVDKTQLPARGQLLINVGSVGQPRDGDPRAAYGVLDMARQRVELRRVPYDILGAQNRIRAEGLPPRLADRLALGR